MPEYQEIRIQRLDDEEANYAVFGLPEGETMNPQNYDRYEASWLKVNGYGFACKFAELSEHGETLTLEQETDGGSLHIHTD
jgi:hypothetical protein